MLAELPEIAKYVAALRKRAKGRGTLALRRLLAMVRDYPKQPLLEAVATASHYGLYDLDRVEHLILRAVAGEYFRIPQPPQGDLPHD